MFSCDTTEPPPKEEKPPGYQEDIPWPSLANSPWPMAHHDPQSTGRSKYSGPIIGEKIWEFEDDNKPFNSGISIDIENQMVKWTFGNKTSIGKSIVVDSQGNLYFEKPSDELSKIVLISLNPDGTLRWELNQKHNDLGRDNTPALDKYGNIYFATDTLYSVDYNGNIRWKIGLEGICDAPILCDESGTIFVPTFTWTRTVYLYSVNENGSINWVHEEKNAFWLRGSAAIGFNQTLYLPIIHHKIIAIK